jgi:hypothetical protein
MSPCGGWCSPVAGEDNLRNLLAEYKSPGPAYRRTVQPTYRASYTNHYRAGLIRLLEALQFRSEDPGQPALEAVGLVRRLAGSPQLTYYPEGKTVPAHGGLSGDWQDLAHRTDGKGRRHVVRTIYEIRTFEALCDQLRRKGMWVAGAGSSVPTASIFRCAECGDGTRLRGWVKLNTHGPVGADGTVERYDYWSEDAHPIIEESVTCRIHGEDFIESWWTVHQPLSPWTAQLSAAKSVDTAARSFRSGSSENAAVIERIFKS